LIEEGPRLEDQGSVDLALDCYRDAVAAAPDAPRAHMNVANALQRLDRLEEALSAARAAVGCDPSYGPARFNLARLLVATGAPSLAELEIQETLRLMPHFVDARILLADIRESEGDFAGSERELRSALAEDASHRGAALNLLQLLLRQRRYGHAERWLFQEMASNPRFAVAALTDVLASLNQSIEADNTTVFEAHRWFGRFVEEAARPAFASWSNTPDPGRRLRIAYVSGDFREHPIAWFMRPILEHHDRAGFDIRCYSAFGGSNERARALQAFVTRWLDVSEMSDVQLAEQIRADAIDILIDLSGHTEHNRLSAFARRPAPVQATWLGYLNTTGLSAIDWRICDRYTDPVGETDKFHVERLFRMPASQWCYSPWSDIPVDGPPADRSRLVFGSFNQYHRISDGCLDLWSKVLLQLPDARILLLDVRNSAVAGNVLERLSRRGIPSDRVEMRGRLPLDEYFKAMRDVDIALDTTPYSGATTALNTLWMGVPVVGLRGRHSLSRGCFSVLNTLGLPDLTAASPAQYVDVNVRLARDAERRHALRSTLRERLRTSPLMDAPAFVSSLEAGYRAMWDTWCASRATRP
jgi:predicted O-linked N-acetylglucosamine transferase (SPINDLY family)